MKIKQRKFAHLRRQTVHTLPYLVHDRPVVGSLETLQKIQDLKNRFSRDDDATGI
jgi:hypothetical protein